LDGLECHAEGGALSDNVELAAAARVLRGGEGGDKEVLAVGSVKTNAAVHREASAMAGILKVLMNISYANNAPTIHLKRLNPYFEAGSAAVRINTESMAYRDSRVFHGIGSRGWGGTNINLVCWGFADASVVPFAKPKMFRQSFAFWPSLEDAKETETGFSVVGSWSDWKKTEPMTRSMDGSYVLNVTLGDKCFESFQIWLDGDRGKVLHPDQPNAPSGSSALGPDPLDLIQKYHLNWLIDGRGSGASKPGSLARPGQRPAAEVQRARDLGQPGDQYRVKLLQGRFRAVTWEKVKRAF